MFKSSLVILLSMSLILSCTSQENSFEAKLSYYMSCDMEDLVYSNAVPAFYEIEQNRIIDGEYYPIIDACLLASLDGEFAETIEHCLYRAFANNALRQQSLIKALRLLSEEEHEIATAKLTFYMVGGYINEHYNNKGSIYDFNQTFKILRCRGDIKLSLYDIQEMIDEGIITSAYRLM